MTAPSAAAFHQETPVAAAPVVAEAFRDTIFDVNDTIGDVEAQTGERLDDARRQLQGATEAHNSGNQWKSMSNLFQALTIAKKAQWEHEIQQQQGEDEDAQFFSKAQSSHQDAQARIGAIHERMMDLQEAGVDLWELDHVLLAGNLLAQGERVDRQYPPLAQQWSDGQRNERMRNGLVAFTQGPILFADIADRIITKTLQQSPDEPVGPVVGNATLEGVNNAITPILDNSSVSFDEKFRSIINGNIQEREWLAALGASVAWSTKQAPAAIQHHLDEQTTPYDAEAVTHHLEDLLHNGTQIEEFDEIGVPGAQARMGYAEAATRLRIAEAQLERSENLSEANRSDADRQTSLTASRGLGALSTVDVSLAILELASGNEPKEDLIHLPISSAGEADLAEGGDSDEPDEGSALPVGTVWIGALTLGALVAVAIVATRRRR